MILLGMLFLKNIKCMCLYIIGLDHVTILIFRRLKVFELLQNLGRKVIDLIKN